MKDKAKETADQAKESLKVNFDRQSSDPDFNKDEDLSAHTSSLV